MQIGTTARHSPIGLFRCVSYLVHLVRDTGWRRPVGRDHQHSTLVVVVLDGEATRGDSRPVRVGLLPKVSGAASEGVRGNGRSLLGSSGGWPRHQATPPGLPPPRHSHLGWQPSRFLTDRGEAERAFQLATQLASVNAAAAELGTTWPSLRKAFTRHGLGMPTRNPEAVRQRAIAAARQRSGQPVTPPLDPVFVALNPGVLPARERSPAELYQWVRRDEQYATLGANVVVELYSESHARKPTTRAWAIIRRADRNHRLAGQRASRPDRRQAERADRLGRSQQPQEREIAADAR
jgi:hypothetical protein